MRIAVIGSGISGLAAANELTKQKHKVVIFEKSNVIGGQGICTNVGKNYIESYYHHFFKSHNHVFSLSEELGIRKKIKFYKVKTGVYENGKIFEFSSAKDLLLFRPLPLLDRIRCGLMSAIFKFIPFPLDSLDNIAAEKWAKKAFGKKVYDKIWGPLLEGKFSDFSRQVSALWLFGRIKDRSFKLGYMDGSIKVLFDALEKKLKKNKCEFKFGTEIISVQPKGEKVILREKNKKHEFDKVIITSVSPVTERIVGGLPDDYRRKLSSIDHLGAICLILELKYPLQSQYWLNICDKNFPFLVLVEHTNMIDSKYYEKKSVVYLGNYFYRKDKRFLKKDEDLIKEYLGALKKINPLFDKSWVIRTHLARLPRAQTIFGLGALKKIPKIQIPDKNIFIVNIDQMYPHDRTIDQGIELGQKAAKLILN